jgi:hypothetical protein
MTIGKNHRLFLREFLSEEMILIKSVIIMGKKRAN